MAELVRRVRVLCLFLFLSGLLGCDHATKLVAEQALRGNPAVPLAQGILELRYTQNHDTAFGLFRSLDAAPSPMWLVATSGVALVAVAIAWWLARRRATPMEHAAYAMIVAGALGNVLDRAVRGYVVDFIHVTHWPVFNVADIAVVLGALALALARARAPAVS